MHGLIEANTEALGGMASPSGGIMTGGKVVPAKAGTHGGAVSIVDIERDRRWIPAFAGMTKGRGNHNRGVSLYAGWYYFIDRQQPFAGSPN